METDTRLAPGRKPLVSPTKFHDQFQIPRKALPQGALVSLPGLKDDAMATFRQDYSQRPCNWLPFTLRWPYLLTLFITSLGLGSAVGMLTWYSAINNGLSTDNGSAVLLFGWRFSPTLVAVLYVLLETLLVNDVRSTEIFARLSGPKGASATSTLLQVSRSWWNDPGDALSKGRNNGKRSWALFWASVANILGMLVISPLSAGLLSPQDIQITKTAGFSHIGAFYTTPFETSADDATYVRAISGLTLNLSTSAWLSNEYAVLPFWPTDFADVPLGATLGTDPQIWEGETAVFQVDLDCRPMVLAGSSPWGSDSLTTGSIILRSEDGCEYGVAAYHGPSPNFWNTGGGWWSTSTGANFPTTNAAGAGSVVLIDHYPTIETGLDIIVGVNSTRECDGRQLFFVTTPLHNESTRAGGYVCSSYYHMANTTVTVLLSSSVSQVVFDEETFNQSKSPIESTFINISSFEDLFLSSQWSTKFQPPQPNPSVPYTEVAGPLLPIAAGYSFDVNRMLASANLVDEARKVKQRFFGEALQSTFSKLGKQNAPSFDGQISFTEQRIVVSAGIGIALSTILLFSAAMFAAVFFHTRLRRRPLNLSRDPGSAAAMTALIADNADVRACFGESGRLSQRSMQRLLSGKTFSLDNHMLSVNQAIGQAPKSSKLLRPFLNFSPMGNLVSTLMNDCRSTA
jgi:hypothetical protein